MFKNYLKIAWRNIFKNKSASFTNLFGLILGISVCTTILIFVRYESTFDDFHEKSDRTFRVVQHTEMPNETLYWNTTAYPMADALREDFPEIDIVTQISGPVNQVFEVEGDSKHTNLFEEPQVLFVDVHYPKIFDVEWLVGDRNTALNDINSAVLTELLAQRYFGKQNGDYQNLLGKTILLQGKDPLTVTGVVKNPKGNADHQYNILIPYEYFEVNNPFFKDNWTANHQGTTYVVLKDTGSQNTLESKIQGWKKKYLKPEDDNRISYLLQPLKSIHNETLYGPSPGGYILPERILYLASGTAFLILLIVIINFVNMATAQSHARSKEVGVRKVMGGSRKSLIFQFLFENGLLILMAALSAIFVVKALLAFLNDHLNILKVNLSFEWMHLGLIALVAVITVILAAVYPAVVLSAFSPIRALKEKLGGRPGKAINLRKSLVTFQFALVQLFVIAAIVLFYQMDYFVNSDLGFSKEAVVITDIPNQDKSLVYRDQLLEEGGISKVAFGSGPPMAINGLQLGTNYRLPEQPETAAMEAEMKVGDTHYLDFYDLKLLAGRNFLSNKEAFDEFIVNETFLKPFGWSAEEAIGKQIQINEGPATIVGVVSDFHNNALQFEISPVIILNWKYFLNYGFIKLSHTEASALSTIENIWNGTFKNAIYKSQFLNDAIAREYAVERLIFIGFGIFSVLAIVLGCLGLFGLMAFIVVRKRKEIGIRKVLGASLLENISFFTKQYVSLVLLAFLITAPMVYFLAKHWLEGFSYRIDLSIWMFFAGGFITLAITILTCSFQSINASRINPIEVLKEE